MDRFSSRLSRSRDDSFDIQITLIEGAGPMQTARPRADVERARVRWNNRHCCDLQITTCANDANRDLSSIGD